MLPFALICLLQAHLTLAQSPLPLNEVHEFFPGPPAIFAIPPFPTNLSVSVAVCSSSNSTPRFFFSNDSSKRVASPKDAEGEGYTEMILQDGFAEWTGGFREGGFLAVTNTGQTPFEIGLSQNGAWCAHTEFRALIFDSMHMNRCYAQFHRKLAIAWRRDKQPSSTLFSTFVPSIAFRPTSVSELHAAHS